VYGQCRLERERGRGNRWTVSVDQTSYSYVATATEASLCGGNGLEGEWRLLFRACCADECGSRRDYTFDLLVEIAV
jgi:hypothetical protein